MSNETIKTGQRAGKITPTLLDVDWTTTSGLTPYYVQASGSIQAYYAVAVETNFSKKTSDFNPQDYKLEGVTKILKHYLKDTEENISRALKVSSIPVGASGTYVPVRPVENIKVLVTVPDTLLTANPPFIFDQLKEAPYIRPVPYDEVLIDTFDLSERVKQISKAIDKFAFESKNFEGRVYNVDLSKVSEKFKQMVPLIGNLVRSNGLEFNPARSDLIMIGVSGSGPNSSQYLPVYAQIDQGDGPQDLRYGFEDFKNSQFITSNIMYLYKNFVSLDSGSANSDQLEGPDGQFPQKTPTQTWQDFVEKYIHFPKAVIEHTTGRPQSPEPDEKLEKTIKEADTASVKTPQELEKENFRVASQEFKKAADAKKKQAAEFIGDNVIANINDTLFEIQGLESLYEKFLDKIGIKYIVRASMRCLGVDLPIEELKAFLRDVNAFLGEVIAILEIPTITLDDLIPTVDIMAGIVDQVLRAIGEAVTKALLEMVKQIIMTLLENCGDVSKANFGGIPIGQAFANGGIGGLLESTAGVLGEAAGDAALEGLATGLRQTGTMPENSRKFLLNLNTFISNDTLQQLASENFAIVGDLIDQVGAVLTPGELSKTLQGKAPPSVIKIIGSVADSFSDVPDAPPSAAILKELLDSPEKINDFFLNVSKVIDEEGVLEQIEQFEQFVPGLQNGLCDLDDSLLRESLLLNKGLTPQEAKEQINASRDRARSRINQLSNLLEKPDLMAGAIPPIYCTYKNGEVQPGLVNNDHESFTFMMGTMLDTVFDGVESTFGQDIARVPELMKVETQTDTETISRTIPDEIGGGAAIGNGFWRINPEFTIALNSGYQANPPYIEVDPGLAKEEGDGNLFGNPTQQNEARNWARLETIRQQHVLPPLVKPVTKNKFIPGLAQSYEDFQTNYSLIGSPEEIKNNKAKALLNVDETVLQVKVKNQLKGLLQEYGGSSQLYQQLSLELATNPQGAVTFGVDDYTLVSQQFANSPAGKDKFAIVIKAGTLNVYNELYEIDINEKAKKVIDDRNLEFNIVASDHSTKENLFVNFLKSVWSRGENIYSSETDEMLPQPEYSKNFDTSVGNLIQGGLLENQADNLEINSLFEELWRDLMASCLTIVGENNNLLNNSYDLLNLSPSPTPECPEPSLLGIKGIKAAIFEMYKQIQCIERSLPNTSGLGDNRNNATEQSSLFGIVKTTVRVYTLEIVLKCLITFNKLMFDQTDEAFVGFIRNNILDGVEAMGYLNVFNVEALKAYNNALVASETDSNVALDWFIIDEIKYAAETLLKIAGAEAMQVNIEELIFPGIDIQDTRGILPEFNVRGWGGVYPNFSGEEFQRLREQDKLVNYHVVSREKIEGIKDWRNGNLYLERYIRADIDYASHLSQDKFGTSSPSEKTKPNPAVGQVGRIGIFEGVVNKDQFPKWFYEQFVNIPPAASRTPQTSQPDASECAPRGPDYNLEGSTVFAASVVPIGEYFKNIRYGIRLVCQITENKSVLSDQSAFRNESFEVIESGILPLSPEQQQKCDLNKSYYVKEKIVGQLSPQEVDAFVFPIVCSEKDIPLDTKISDIINSFNGDANATSNFFTDGYNRAYREISTKLKQTDEWSFIFNYCFPLRRLVSLSALYNITYLQSFPGLGTVFRNTKEQLRMAFVTMIHSGNYTYKDPDWSNKAIAQATINGRFPGLDIGKMALMFLTGLLKGAGETFSPNIAIARKIQVVAELAAKATVGIIEDPSAICQAFTQRKPNESEEEYRRRCNVPECPPGEVDIDIPILPISLALLPVDVIPPPFGYGPPLTPLGIAYLAAQGAGAFDQFKSEETKQIERCNTKKKEGTDFTNRACPPTGSI